jgi:hypothetical protein
MSSIITTCVNQVFVPVGDSVTSLHVSNHPYRCGKCVNCRKARQFDLSLRLMKELRHANSAKFLTPTFSPEFYPDDVEPSGYSQKAMDMIHSWVKHLRYCQKVVLSKWRGRSRVQYVLGFPVYMDSIPVKPIKYLIVPELGSLNGRLHFHAIVFNVHPDVWQMAGSTWKFGRMHHGSVSVASVNYAVKYVTKDADMTLSSGRKMRTRMSQNIGVEYVRKMSHDLLSRSSFEVTFNGKVVQLSRYLRSKVGYSKKQLIARQMEVMEAMAVENESRISDALRSCPSVAPEFYLMDVNHLRAGKARETFKSYV